MAPVKLAVMGGSMVGKSALVARRTMNRFTLSYSATITDFYEIIAGSPARALQVEDSTGGDPFDTIRDVVIRNNDSFVLVYDITSRASFEFIEQLCDRIYTIKCEDGQKAFPISVLVGNKSDLAEERQVTESRGQNLAQSYGSSFMETSTRINTNVDEIFERIAQLNNEADYEDVGREVRSLIIKVRYAHSSFNQSSPYGNGSSRLANVRAIRHTTSRRVGPSSRPIASQLDPPTRPRQPSNLTVSSVAGPDDTEMSQDINIDPSLHASPYSVEAQRSAPIANSSRQSISHLPVVPGGPYLLDENTSMWRYEHIGRAADPPPPVLPSEAPSPANLAQYYVPPERHMSSSDVSWQSLDSDEDAHIPETIILEYKRADGQMAYKVVTR